MKKCYYAHSMHLYGKPQEERDIKSLIELGFHVINPSDSRIKEGLSKYKEENPDVNLMEYFYDIILDCDLVAFRAHPDLKIPSGVGGEISYATSRNIPIIEIPTLPSERYLSLNDTKYYLTLLGER